MLSETDAAVIRSLAATMDEQALAGNFEGMVDLFEEDCVLMPPNGPEIHGREAFYSFIDSMGFKAYTHKIDLLEIDGSEDLAVARGAYSESYSAAGVDGVIEDQGKIIATARRQSDGGWKFSRWMWNSDLGQS